jgi:hypothetical protein
MMIQLLFLSIMVVWFRRKLKGVKMHTFTVFKVCGFRTKRNISSVSHKQIFGTLNPTLTEHEMKSGTRLGSDSHADTTCVNKHAYIETVVEGMTVDAIPFDERIGRLSDLPIVHAIYAIDNTATFETSLLRFNHSIYIQDMGNPLLCPNQARVNGTIVDDVPPHLDHTGSSTFALHVGDIMFPFQPFGPTAYLHVRRPTDEELNSLPILDVTDEHGWDPYSDSSTSQGICRLSTSNYFDLNQAG